MATEIHINGRNQLSRFKSDGRNPRS